MSGIKEKKEKAPHKRYLDSDTDTASEGESNGETSPQNKKVQVDVPLPFLHRFSVAQRNSYPESVFRFYTGFPNYEIFSTVLDLLVPNGERNSIKYYDYRN